MRAIIKTIVLAGALGLTHPEAAWACEKCFGGGSEAEGITMAMLALVAMTGVVWGGIGAFFVNMRRRIRQIEPGSLVVSEHGDLLESADPPH